MQIEYISYGYFFIFEYPFDIKTQRTFHWRFVNNSIEGNLFIYKYIFKILPEEDVELPDFSSCSLTDLKSILSYISCRTCGPMDSNTFESIFRIYQFSSAVIKILCFHVYIFRSLCAKLFIWNDALILFYWA